MGAITSRRNGGVEEVDISTSNAYKYPPKSGVCQQKFEKSHLTAEKQELIMHKSSNTSIIWTGVFLFSGHKQYLSEFNVFYLNLLHAVLVHGVMIRRRSHQATSKYLSELPTSH